MNKINMCMATLFRGFSTVDKVKAPFGLTDIELVKRDLLNEFYTRKGERLMRPNFGSIIWDLLMNPEDTFTVDEIREDIERIIAKEDRVELIDVSIFTADHSVRAEVELNYVILNSKDTLYLEFTTEQQV
jgi:phage baseplate assembly protein W